VSHYLVVNELDLRALLYTGFATANVHHPMVANPSPSPDHTADKQAVTAIRVSPDVQQSPSTVENGASKLAMDPKGRG